jgi:UDP-GlcNAc:undecaprenyl-phosphate GlcNAc-1-phosphate transferase
VPDLAGYAFVGFVAALFTTVATPIVRWVALRFGWVVPPDDRRVHAQPTPAIGGVAMFIGLVAAMAAAWKMDRFTILFDGNSEPLGVVIAAAVIFAIGLIDDLHPISAPAKVTGIVVAGAVLAWFGVTMFYFRVPFSDVISIGPDWIPLVTVIWLLVMGFLPHNFNPARIFMGDGGALLLGLMMAASTSVVGGRANPNQGFSGQTYFFLAPLAIPLVILGVPILDTAFAIARRAAGRTHLTVADKNHLHHRLMRLGHGQRRSVLILWLWTALLSGLVLYPTYTGEGDAFVPLGVAALALILYTVLHPGVRRTRDEFTG